MSAVVVGESVDLLVRNNVACCPERHLRSEPLLNQGLNVISGSGCTETANLLDFRFAALCMALDALFFVDDAIELVTHAPGLSLTLDFIAIDGAPALRRRARSVAALYGSRRVI